VKFFAIISNSIFGAFGNHDQLGSVDNSSYLMHANHVLCMETVEIGSLSSPHKKKLIIALAKEASKFERPNSRVSIVTFII
jgi:hypothetical protein